MNTWEKNPLIEKMGRGEKVIWINPDKTDFAHSVNCLFQRRTA